MNVRAIIADIIAVEIPVDEGEIGDTSSITEDLGGDSLDVVEIVMTIEERFDITIGDEEMERVENVKGLVELVERKIKEKGGNSAEQ